MNINLNIVQAISYMLYNANFISVMGFTLLQWAIGWIVFVLSVQIVSYIIRNMGNLFGVGLSVAKIGSEETRANMSDDNSFYFDEDGQFQKGQAARNAAWKEIKGE